MLALRKILFPFSILYGWILGIRHFLYNKGIFRSVSHEVPVISVGNLSFGGTGKTPMTEYLIRLLKDDYRVAVLSRGYKRASKGFYLAGENVSVRDLGDEPWQYHKKFPEINVAVDANRNRGVFNLMTLPKPPDVILLDDAFQHRNIDPGLHILLTTYADLYVDDLLFPAGNLRDIKGRAGSADIIIVSKCPETLTEKEQLKMKNKIKPEPHQKLFFTTVKYKNSVISAAGKLALKDLALSHFTLLTGIADPAPLVSFLKGKGLNFEHLKYPDHHEFSEKEIATLTQKKIIVTTEKDYARLGNKLPYAYYLPVKTAFLSAEAVFNKQLKQYINT